MSIGRRFFLLRNRVIRNLVVIKYTDAAFHFGGDTPFYNGDVYSEAIWNQTF